MSWDDLKTPRKHEMEALTQELCTSCCNEVAASCKQANEWRAQVDAAVCVALAALCEDVDVPLQMRRRRAKRLFRDELKLVVPISVWILLARIVWDIVWQWFINRKELEFAKQ